MKISESCLSFNAQHNRQVERVSEHSQSSTPLATTTPTTSVNGTRVSLNSNQWQSVNLYASNGTTLHQQQWNQQQQFNRFYNSTSLSQRSELSTNRATATSAYSRYQENQYTQVNISGSLLTDCANEIQFQFSAGAGSNFILELGRGEYAERITGRTDPLIINYDGGFNNLSSQAYAFDLDGDGKEEMVSFAGAGSGFLAWDKNGDGIINNGHELFGTLSGDGFAELVNLDEDGNGFIDAGDSIFSQLSIFSKDSAGNDSLRQLSDFDIAAISIQSVATPFRITDHLNQEQGLARSTGVFIRSDGSVGSVQQIDLTKRDTTAERRMAEAFAAPSDDLPVQETEDTDNQELDDLMRQIEMARQSRLDRQQELANQADEKAEPKTLLEQLVDELEAYTVAQRDKRKDD